MLTSCRLPRQEGGWRHNLWLHYNTRLPWLDMSYIVPEHVNVLAQIEGELYAATHNGGLLRWRGDGFERHGFPLGEISAVFPYQGRLGAAGPFGFAIFDGKEWSDTVRAGGDDLAAAGVAEHVLMMDAAGHVAALAGGKIDGLSACKARGLVAGDGLLVLDCADKLLILREKSGTVAMREVANPWQGEEVVLKSAAQGEQLWLATSRGLYSLDAAANAKNYAAPVLGTRERGVDAVALNGDELWIAAGREVAMLSARDLVAGKWHSTVYGRKSGLPRADITSIVASDKEVWVGTRGRGLARLKRRVPVSGAGEQESRRAGD